MNAPYQFAPSPGALADLLSAQVADKHITVISPDKVEEALGKPVDFANPSLGDSDRTGLQEKIARATKADVVIYSIPSGELNTALIRVWNSNGSTWGAKVTQVAAGSLKKKGVIANVFGPRRDIVTPIDPRTIGQTLAVEVANNLGPQLQPSLSRDTAKIVSAK